jgi:hypothetical protein
VEPSNATELRRWVQDILPGPHAVADMLLLCPNDSAEELLPLLEQVNGLHATPTCPCHSLVLQGAAALTRTSRPYTNTSTPSPVSAVVLSQAEHLCVGSGRRVCN